MGTARFASAGPPERSTVTGALAAAVERHGDEVFLDVGGTTATYGEVDEAASRTANLLAGLGVGRGDRVLTMLGTSVDAVAVWFATSKLGALNVPVNTANRREFLRHQIADSGARVVVVEHELAGRVDELREDLPPVTTVVRGAGRAAAGHGAVALEEAAAEPATFAAEPPGPGDLCSLIYTSGTSGRSKGCMISHRYMTHLGRQVLANTSRQRDEVLWTPLPLFHINATATAVVSTMLLGGRVAIAPRFSLSGFWPEIERTGARIVNLLGAMFVLIADQEDTPAARRCHGQVRHANGSPVTPELERRWRERFGVRRVGSYVFGMTEAALITSCPPGAAPPPGCCGRGNDAFDVRILGPGDEEVAPGTVGEIACRPLAPDVMFSGYWGDPEATAKAFRNLWFHTGDLGRFDEHGWLYFVDRKEDVIRRRGENVSGFEMDQVLRRHPDVAEVAVHGVASDLLEQEVKVTAVLVAGSGLTPEELCRWCADEVPYFAVPRYVEFRDELPKNEVGRVLKSRLRAEGVTGATWDREAAGLSLPRT